MRKFYTTLLLVLCTISYSYAQSEEYRKLIKAADSLFKAQDYKRSTYAYMWAFKVNNYRGTLNDRYKASRAWSMHNLPDSAFYHLLKIAEQGNFIEYDCLINEEAFTPLHEDARWDKLTQRVRLNLYKAEANLDKGLKAKLEAVYDNVWFWHSKLDSLKKTNPADSQAIAKLNSTVAKQDSLAKAIVTTVWETTGWVGPNVVGKKGRDAQFIVLKYASLYTQKKYYTLFKKAVTADFATLEQMAIIEDVMALKQGKRQPYGTQLGINNYGKYFLEPAENVLMINKRRAEIGLEPLAEYLFSNGVK